MQTIKRCHCTVRFGYIFVCFEFGGDYCFWMLWWIACFVGFICDCAVKNVLLFLVKFCIKVHVNGNLWFENDILKCFIHLNICSGNNRREMCHAVVVVSMTAVAWLELSFYRCGLVLFRFRFRVNHYWLVDFFSFYSISAHLFESLNGPVERRVLTVFPAGRKSRGWHEGSIPEDLNPAPHAWINHPFVKSQQRRIAYLIWTRGMGIHCVCVLWETLTWLDS